MKLAYSVSGSGPALILLHGLFGSGDNLRRVARWFENQFTVYLPDLPNHAGSPWTDEASYPQMVDAVLGFIAEHTTGSVWVAGHSMGAKVAMCVALKNPSLVSGLMVLDMAPREYPSTHQAILDGLSDLDLGLVENRADADRLLAPAIPSDPVRAFLLKNLEKADAGYRWRLNLSVLRRDYRKILRWDGTGTYGGPALFVGGTESTYLRPQRDEGVIQEYFPQASVQMIAGAGHWIHAEKSAELEAILKTFMTTVRQS